MSFLERLKPYIDTTDVWKKKAWSALEKIGLPTKKWDAFKYVPLNALYTASLTPVYETFSKEKEIISLTFEEAHQKYGAILQKSFEEHLAQEKNPFALLNTAFSKEGQFLYIPPGKNVDLHWEWTFDQGLRTPRIEIFVGKKAHCNITFKCKGSQTYFCNTYLHLTLEQGASASFDEHLEHSSKAFAMHTLRAELKKDAHLNWFTFSKGAQLERHDLQAVLSGENSEVSFKGLCLPSQKDQVHQFITAKHQVERTRSYQHYKTALMDEARSSFEGKIFVEKKAQKTEAYQLNNHLLLSPKAQAMSKPNLEIYADDVKASHGATMTEPKEEELFYLQSRGLTLEEAKWQLARGFCRELIDEKRVDQFLKVKRKDHAAV